MMCWTDNEKGEKNTHFPPVFKNAVKIFFTDFACVVIKADEKGKKNTTY